jgi:hypothetical protein
LFTELTEDEDGIFTDEVLELGETVLLCAISTCANDDATFVGKVATCFDFAVTEEGALKSSENNSGGFEECGPLFDNILEGILVDGIFLVCISVHLEVEVNAAVCFGLNACTVGVRNGCILVFSPVCACSLVLDGSGMDVFKLKIML